MSRMSSSELFSVLMRQDLSSFIQRSFSTVDPGSPYHHNWHLDAIAHQLERVARGETRRLIISMPPRSMKSIAASIAFPAWILGRNPRTRILAASHAESLSEKFARDSLKILMSDWYQAAFPMTRIARSHSKRQDFETTRGGGRYSTSVGGALTGRGGDIIIIDDPHKPDEAQSEARRTGVLDWYASTLLSRCNDPKNTPIILIQQRIHENDLAGMLLEQGGWDHLSLPAIAEETKVYDLGRRRSFTFAEGEPLHADRLPLALLKDYQSSLGSYVFAAQYQQRPAPLEGGIVKWPWFQTYDLVPEPCPGDEIVQSWDTASSAGELNDYSVCTTWLVRNGRGWMIDLWRGRLEFPQLRSQILSQAAAANANRILIEQAGSGLSLVQDLMGSTRLNVLGIVPRLDKTTRLLSVSAMIESGRVLLPKEAPWLADFHRELTLFPNARHDQVDSFSQFLTWLNRPTFEWYVSGE